MSHSDTSKGEGLLYEPDHVVIQSLPHHNASEYGKGSGSMLPQEPTLLLALHKLLGLSKL